MTTCCPLCNSGNQLSFETAAVCMECATVATPMFTLPLGLMVAGLAVAFLSWKAIQILGKCNQLTRTNGLKRMLPV